MTIAERLQKLAAKEDAAGGTVSVGGLVIDVDALISRRERADQKQRDREDDFAWEIAEWGGLW